VRPPGLAAADAAGAAGPGRLRAPAPGDGHRHRLVPRTLRFPYWSGSACAGIAWEAWTVSFGNGEDHVADRSVRYFLRLVRDAL
jgi:hypothetical protein